MRIKKSLFCLIAVVLLPAACAIPGTPPEPVQTPSAGQPSSTAPAQTTSPLPGQEPLPKPIVTGNPVETCLNSRYSEHSLSGTASKQQIANILWAAGRAPLTGAYRHIYVSTPEGEYLYDPATHALSRHSDQRVTDGAFVINCESELAFDTGTAYMLAMLASVSLWNSSEPAVVSCPKHSSLHFGVQGVKGLTTELVAHSSTQGSQAWLPDPSTTGDDKLEEVLADLKYGTQFSAGNLTPQQISQLLWAGYGCTPHVTSNSRAGLTVPSAMAKYYLTGTIYLASESGVYRYQNRNPNTDLTTRDHRLEPVSSGDARASLMAAVSGLPQAPCYVIICLGSATAGNAQEQTFALLETGFVGGNMLAQATALGLGCNFKTPLTTDEQTAIRKAAGIPSSEMPQVIISLGGLTR